MNWRSDFVGREELLADLLDLLVREQEEGLLVSIQAPGGMGKTRLVQELAKGLSNQGRGGLFVHDIALSANRVALALEERILRERGAETELFLTLSRAYRTRQGARQGYVESAASLLDAASAAFGEALTTAGSYPLLIIDTVDLPMSTSSSLRRLLRASVRGVPGVRVVLAGRDSHAVAQELTDQYEWKRIDLPPLGPAAAACFLDPIGLDRPLQERLTQLAGGRPVLLGLASEWLESGDPLPDVLVWEGEGAYSSLPTAEEDRLSFEKALVTRLLDLKGDLDVFLLEMARQPFRFTAGLTAYLHGVDERSAESALARLAGNFYVKQISPDSFVLHDEMRDLVNEHVWPVVDPLGSERRAMDARVAQWYRGELARGEGHQRDADGAQGDLDGLDGRDCLEPLLLGAEAEFFGLRQDPQTQAEVFLRQMRAALAAGEVDYCGLALEMCREIVETLPDSDRARYSCLEAEWLRLIGRRQKCREVLEGAREQYAGIPAPLRVELLLALARAMKELGDSPQASEVLKEARGLAVDDRQRASIELLDGECMLSVGLVAGAVERLRVVPLLIGEGDEGGIAARALDRAAYARSVLGARIEAETLAREAIARSLDNGLTRQAAEFRNTLASIHRDGSRFAEAKIEYGEAVEFFVESGDMYWQATTLMERGLCSLLEYEEIRYGGVDCESGELARILRDSQSDLSKSVSLCKTYNREELPKASHELGHVMWEQGDVEATRQVWGESLQTSLKSGNLRYVLENYIGMCELDIDTEQFSDALRWRAEVMPYFEQTRSSHALLWSRLRKLEAQAQFAMGDFDLALEGFCGALPQLARHGGWGRYKLEFELASLGALVASLGQKTGRHWLSRLQATWRAALSDLSPERGALLADALLAYEQQLSARRPSS
jgi:tetratricopeptide (TPR) repeat protein